MHLWAVDVVLLNIAAHARKCALLLGVPVQPDVTRHLSACARQQSHVDLGLDLTVSLRFQSADNIAK